MRPESKIRGGMNLQSADPAGQTKAPKVKRKPPTRKQAASEGKDKAPDKEVRASVH